MQQIPPQRENPIGTFQNNLRAQNQVCIKIIIFTTFFLKNK